MAVIVEHTFSSVEASSPSDSRRKKSTEKSGQCNFKKTMVIRNSGATFSLDIEATIDNGDNWDVIDTFTASEVKNLEWMGDNAGLRGNMTAITGGTVFLSIK